jgi:hypothetical protein
MTRSARRIVVLATVALGLGMAQTAQAQIPTESAIESD